MCRFVQKNLDLKHKEALGGDHMRVCSAEGRALCMLWGSRIGGGLCYNKNMIWRAFNPDTSSDIPWVEKKIVRTTTRTALSVCFDQCASNLAAWCGVQQPGQAAWTLAKQQLISQSREKLRSFFSPSCHLFFSINRFFRTKTLIYANMKKDAGACT